MKKVIIYICATLVVLPLCIVSCKQKNKTQLVDNKKTNMALDSSDVKNMPVLKFTKTRHDFGTFKKEKIIPINIIHIDFEFQNVGDVPLLIHKVDVSCGCFSVEYPKEPTKPNEKGIIEVKVDAQNITGAFNKTLFVKSNATEDVILLRIFGQIM